MSFDEVKDIKITIKKWVIIFFMITVSPLLGVGAFVVNSYYDTVGYKKETSRELQELKDDITASRVALQNKVSAEEMKDFKSDMKQEMKDIKILLNILIEKK